MNTPEDLVVMARAEIQTFERVSLSTAEAMLAEIERLRALVGGAGLHNEVVALGEKVGDLLARNINLLHESECWRRRADGGEWSGEERRGADSLGGVLCYTSTGHNKPCGQTLGANGSGDFALLIGGDPEQAESASREYLRRLQGDGHILVNAVFVPNCANGSYGGNPIRAVRTADLLVCEKR